uniref:Glucosylceramidase n=1 Tax=Solibacter usitatus (strain Ellin6076) TaxID=234267 RepID=Q024E9_SOLUE
MKALIAILGLASFMAGGQQGSDAEVWLTTPDKSALFERQKQSPVLAAPGSRNPTIEIDERQKFQPIDGFGFALTGGSAQHLVRMSAAARAAILKELFGTADREIGVSYLRLTIGASDLNDHVFTYDDMPDGQTDPDLQHFDLGPDKADVIPVMKEILKLNPRIKILASPWTAPSWMKTNNNAKGGALKPEAYPAYAQYFVKYIRAMKAEGIAIDAITVQNEPLNPKNTPSLVMQSAEEALFIKSHLGPAFHAAGIKTHIVLYDHNCDVPEYATAILADRAAARYVDGSGFHLYGGKIEAMTQVHDQYPVKNLYFTEQMVVGSVESKPAINIAAPVRRLIIGATRNWSRNVVLWNLAADPKNNPHTDDGGCGMCQGAITIDGDQVSRNLAYYAIAHASKFVRPGAVRIASTSLESLPNVAFRTPSGKRVLIVVNASQTSQTFDIQAAKRMSATLPPGAVATYVW